MKIFFSKIIVFFLFLTEIAIAQTALDFDGIDDNVASAATLNQDDNFTLEAYAQWRTNTETYQTLIGFGSTVEIKGYNDDITYVSENGTATVVPTPLINEHWYHFALVRDVGVWKFYVDGVFHPLSQRPTPTPDPSQTFRMGGRGTSENWNGAIEEVRVWTVARTQTEIQENMDSCLNGDETGLYLYYRMDDGMGSTTVTDMTGNDNHGTLNNMDINSDWLSGTGIVCPAPVVSIHDVQGSGSEVTSSGSEVTVEGVVTGDYQESEELKGFFLQEEDADIDADPNTSEGLFVYCGTCTVDVAEGQIVRVTGVQEELFGMSQLDVPQAVSGSVSIINSGNNSGLVTPTSIDLPASTGTDQETTFEAIEGMLVNFIDTLTVTEYFQMGRYGQVVLSEGGRQRIYTEDNPPDPTGYNHHLDEKEKRRIILDDIHNTQNTTDPVFYPQPDGFSTTNYFRGGDTVTNLTGVLHWSWAGSGGTDFWRIRPQKNNLVSFTPANPRPIVPEPVGGDIRVASVNLLNYFSTIDSGISNCGPSFSLRCRGADSATELTLQTDKLVAALAGLDADIVGLMEMENNTTSSLQTLIDALNADLGAGSYAFINTGTIGNDAIKNGFIYKPTVVSPMGDHAVLATPTFVDPNSTGSDKNRPALAQTFQVIDKANPSYNEKFTAVVLHLKSKGSPCGGLDDDATTGQGNCNQTRTLATVELMDWLDQDPTGSGDADVLILGDLNAYAMEEPVTAIKLGADDTAGSADDFVDLLENLGGDGYSYVFDGEFGSLQRVLVNKKLASNITGVSVWHINADEVHLLDYNDAIRDASEASFEAKPSTNALYNADAYRFGDHDPLLIGLNLASSFCFPIPSLKGGVAVICL